MSSWERVQRLPARQQLQTQQLYGPNVPIEVRRALAEWIDKQNWPALNPDSPELAQYIPVVAQQLVQQLEEKASTTDDFITRNKLTEILNQIKLNYMDASFLLRALRQCIICEQKIISQFESGLGVSDASDGTCSSIPPSLLLGADTTLSILQERDDCRRNVQLMEEQIRHMVQLEEDFVIQYQDLQKRNAHIQQLQQQQQVAGSAPPIDLIQRSQQEVAQFESLIKERARELHQARINFVERIRGSLQQLSALQRTILDQQLANWHRAQQLAGNGQAFENNLDQIADWCEVLFELICQHRQLMGKLEFLINKIPTSLGATLKEGFSVLDNQIKGLMSVLVSSTFVIEKQPPQVMKTNTRFTATVRLLIGGKQVYINPPQVKVSIISEAQAAALLSRADPYPTNEVSGEILNNIGAMEYHQATKQMSVSFRNMSLKKIKRAEKKGTESVMDEKFCLLFQSIIKVHDMSFSVQAQSLPVVVIVHGNQEPHAWATVTWDNAFSEQQRLPFVVPDRVPWGKMAHVLSTKFRSATGSGLSDANLQFLATKAFRNSNLAHDSHNLPLTWSQFCKEPLPDRNFTFWEWFYAIMKITREHLRALWNEGVVLGFVSRRDAEDMLMKKHYGTFLLRFSDSELGGVSIAWVRQLEGGGKEILMVQPFTSKDFQIRSLADRISDLQNLLYLYPDTVKDQVFSKFYTPTVEQAHGQSTNGYVKPMLVTQIPGLEQQANLDSSPATPQSFYTHSADSQNLYGVGASHAADPTFADHPASMQLYALSAAQGSSQSLKRLRQEEFCSLPPQSQQQQQVSN